MDQILNYFKRRANSTVLVAYSIFWAILHWRGIVTLLFVDQGYIMEKYGLLKNEYLAQQHFFGFYVPKDFCGWVEEVIAFLLPFVLAYLYVWWLPKFVTNPSYRREMKYKTERRIVKLNEDEKVSREEAKLTQANTRKLEAQTKLAKAKQEVLQQSPETAWKSDFLAFRSENPNWDLILSSIQRTVYYNRGNTSEASENTLLIGEVYGLIEFDARRITVKLTEKASSS